VNLPLADIGKLKTVKHTKNNVCKNENVCACNKRYHLIINGKDNTSFAVKRYALRIAKKPYAGTQGEIKAVRSRYAREFYPLSL